MVLSDDNNPEVEGDTSKEPVIADNMSGFENPNSIFSRFKNKLSPVKMKTIGFGRRVLGFLKDLLIKFIIIGLVSTFTWGIVDISDKVLFKDDTDEKRRRR